MVVSRMPAVSRIPLIGEPLLGKGPQLDSIGLPRDTCLEANRVIIASGTAIIIGVAIAFLLKSRPVQSKKSLAGLHPYDWTDRVRRVWRGNPLFS